ncbi:MucBP domain-containing protein, partial [Lacticaseibacillus hegangensis]
MMKASPKSNSLRVDTDRKIHYKMFKDGKKWVFTGLVTTFFTVLPFVQVNTVKADTTTNLEPTAQVTNSDSSATAANVSNTAVLETQAATAAIPETTPAKALLEIKNAQATTTESGLVTVTGTTTANAQVTATAENGITRTVTADENGYFSVALNGTSTVILKASLDGHSSEPAAVVVPKAKTTAEQETATPTSAVASRAALAEVADNSQAEDTQSAGNAIRLVDPSDDEIAAAKASATDSFNKTGLPQTIQVLMADTDSSQVEEVYNKSFLQTLQLTKSDAYTSVDGQIIVKAGVREVKDGDTTKKYLAYDQPITITFDHFSNLGSLNTLKDKTKDSGFKLFDPSTWAPAVAHMIAQFAVGNLTAEQIQQMSAGTSDTAALTDINKNTDILLHGNEAEQSTLKPDDLFRLAPVTGAGQLQVGVFSAEALDKTVLNQISDVSYADPTFDWDTLAKTDNDDNSTSLTFTLSADQVKQAFGTHGGYLYVKIPGKMSSLKITDLLVPAEDGSIGTDAKVEVVDTPTDTTTDTPTDTPAEANFPVTYKYVDGNGNEIANSQQQKKLTSAESIDFSPLNPPAGYTFDPKKTEVDITSAFDDQIKSDISSATDFAGLSSALAKLGIAKVSALEGSNTHQVTITYHGTKTEVKKYTAKVIYVDQADGHEIRDAAPLGSQPAGQPVVTTKIPKTVEGYTMVGEDPIKERYVFTDQPDQVVTLTYKKNDAGGTGTGTGTDTPTAQGKITVNLVVGENHDALVVPSDPNFQQTYYLDGDIGTGIPAGAVNKTAPGFTIIEDGTLKAKFTDKDQTILIVYAPVATKGTITVNLVDENNQPIKNTDGQSSIDLEGNIGDSITTVTLNKDVTSHKITTDGTTDATFTKTAQTFTIKYAPVETKGTITVKLVDENNKPISNTDGQSSIDLKGNIGDSITTVTLNKDVPGHKIATDGTTNAKFTETAQTLTIKYATDGPRVYTPGNPGSALNGDPTTVTSRYLIGTVQAIVKYNGDGAPAEKKGSPIQIYRTATLDASGAPVYTPWTTNSTGAGGNDTDVLLTPITESDIPTVANKVGKIVDETNKTITSADLPLVGKKVTASDGSVLIDGTQNTNIGGKYLTNFIATRVVNYGANQPDLQWHDAPTDPTDPLYNDTHKVLHPIMMMIKDGVTTKQDDNEDEVVLTRQYQIDDNDPDSGVKDYGPWIVDDTGKFMTVGYTPVIYDGYKASPANIDQNTQDDDHKTVTEELAAMAAETADQDKEITFTINYDKEKAELVEHPAPNEPRDVNYDDTHKFLNVTINGDQNGQKKLLETGKVVFNRTYYTEGDTTNKVVKYGDWKQTAPFATFTPEPVDGATPTPAQVTETTVGDDGQSIKQAAAGLLAAADDEDKDITITVTYAKAEAAKGTGTVHYVYQNVDGIELKDPETVSGEVGYNYSNDYSVPDTLSGEGKGLSDADGTLDTSVLHYYATADINGGQINNLPDDSTADGTFGTSGQDIWVIYVAKPKASAADTVTAEEIEGDADHPNGGTRITVKHVDGSPDTVTTVWNGNDGVTPVVDPNGTDNGDGTTTYQITADGQPAGSFTVKNGEKGKDGVDGQTPQIKTTDDGKIVFYIPGSKGDGTNDTKLAEIDAPKSGDTITATPAGVTEDHPNGGTTITVKHGDGSADTVTTVWNGNDGATPVISQTGKDNGDGTTTYDVTANGKPAGTITIKNGKDGADAKTPLVRDGKDGKVEFYLPGTKEDGSDETVLGSIEPPKDGDTITATPVDGDDTHPNGGTKITVKHGDGSDDTVTTVWNGNDGATPVISQTGKDNG